MSEHTIRIHVDQKPYHSPSPTKAVDLYELVHVLDGQVLYKEVDGNREDTPLRIDQPEVHLVEDQHFHTGHPPAHYYVITVNTDPVVVHHEDVSFEQLVKIAFPVPPTGTDPEFTVSYEHAASHPDHGDLAEHRSVKVKKFGTLFDVGHTNRS